MKINGFYFGRYETSLGENNIAQSKYGKTAMSGLNWFQMYEYQKLYSNNNVNFGAESEMVWGSQWMQAALFVDGKLDKQGNVFDIRNTGNRQLDDVTVPTGKNPKDIVQNIYDLEAGRMERTQNANKYTFTDPQVREDKNRYARGGWNGRSLLCMSSTRVPTTNTNSLVSSRMTLWIK